MTAREMKREPKNKRGGRGRGRFPSFLLHPPPRSFTCAIFGAVFDSCSSFFAPKPHRDACYAGYCWCGGSCCGKDKSRRNITFPIIHLNNVFHITISLDTSSHLSKWRMLETYMNLKILFSSRRGKFWPKIYKIGLYLKQKYEIFRDVSRIFRAI